MQLWLGSNLEHRALGEDDLGEVGCAMMLVHFAAGAVASRFKVAIFRVITGKMSTLVVQLYMSLQEIEVVEDKVTLSAWKTIGIDGRVVMIEIMEVKSIPIEKGETF